MEYQEVIHTIENKKRFGSLPGVTVSRQLLDAAGNPERGLSFLHIAGTNGKGSTAAFLASILTESGIRTGLFTSPHLIDFTERIQIDGTQIPKETAARLGEMLLRLPLYAEPAMFDYCLAMALLYFREQNVGLSILETGLGGRLDSTNAVGTPLVSVITKIGYDHTAILGNTLEEIASEKAGILKKGTRAVLEDQTPGVLDLLRQTCSNLDIPYKVIDTSKICSTETGFTYPGETPYQINMQGEFQRENALAAVFAARELAALSYPVTEASIHRGVANAFWSGRMEILSEHPFLMVDGAHNGNGAKALAQSLRARYPNEKFHFIMGILADKDYREMADCVLPLAGKITAATPESSRALQGSALLEYIRQFGVSAEQTDDLKKLFTPFFLKQDTRKPKLRTVAFGSLYFIGEIKKLILTLTDTFV